MCAEYKNVPAVQGCTQSMGGDVDIVQAYDDLYDTESPQTYPYAITLYRLYTLYSI